MSDERITVMGIGNPLVKDEGIGVRVVEALVDTYEFPPNVTVLDAGTMGMGILNLLRECDYLLVIDAVDGTGQPAGTIVRFSAEDLAPNQVMHSLHDIRFVDVLEAAELAGIRPQSDFIGVQVKDMDGIAVGLTEELEDAIPGSVEAILAVLAERGVAASAKASPSGEDVLRIPRLLRED